MTDEKAIAKADISLEQYGKQTDIAVMGARIREMLPGGDKLTDTQAMAVAQAAILVGANPFRGEIYGFTDRNGKLVIDEGYKLLVRWAKDEMPYTEWYDPIEVEPKGSIGYRCYVLRQDNRELFSLLLKSGQPFEMARDIATTNAVGVVLVAELNSPPPKGWTWDQRARVRALKNTLKLSHGAPSLEDLAKASYRVNGYDTEPGDWRDVTPKMSQAEREAMAVWNARERERQANPQPAETVADAVAELYGTQAVIEGHFDEDPPEPGRKGYAFKAAVIQAVIDAKCADNPPHASRMLNLSKILTDKDEPDLCVAWAKAYREARNNELSSDDAAIAADQHIKPVTEAA